MVAIPEAEHTTVKAIYDAYERQPQTERTYLGASTFGHECDRHLWYAFRWAAPPEELSGRKLRLFETGHREEERIILELRGAGCDVVSQQWEMSGAGGHLKGHIDGVAVGIPEAPKTPHVLEVKTHNEKSFKALLKDGVKKSKPAHYVQMQLYMHYTEIDRALYVAVNKNDDSLYSERIEYDKVFAEALVKRAERIVKAEVAPGRLSDDPAYYVCGWCNFKGVCHEKEVARRNCRTCISSSPVANGEWHCAHWDKMLTAEDQCAGCDQHLMLPSLISGEQFDADEENRTISYHMADGTIWVDGGDRV